VTEAHLRTACPCMLVTKKWPESNSVPKQQRQSTDGKDYYCIFFVSVHTFYTVFMTNKCKYNNKNNYYYH